MNQTSLFFLLYRDPQRNDFGMREWQQQEPVWAGPAHVPDPTTAARVPTAGPSSGNSATLNVGGIQPNAQIASTPRINASSYAGGMEVPDRLSTPPSNPRNPLYWPQPTNTTTQPLQGNQLSASPGMLQGNSHLLDPSHQSSLYNHLLRGNCASDSL